MDDKQTADASEPPVLAAGVNPYASPREPTEYREVLPPPTPWTRFRTYIPLVYCPVIGAAAGYAVDYLLNLARMQDWIPEILLPIDAFIDRDVLLMAGIVIGFLVGPVMLFRAWHRYQLQVAEVQREKLRQLQQ